MIKYLVVDNAFNRHWHSDIVGQIIDTPRPYCILHTVDTMPEISPEDIAAMYADVQTSIYDGEV